MAICVSILVSSPLLVSGSLGGLNCLAALRMMLPCFTCVKAQVVQSIPLTITLFSADSGGFDTRCLHLGLTRGKEEWIFGPQRVFCYSLSLSFLFDSCYPSQDPAAADAYALGLLLHAVFNPNQGSPATAQPPHAAPLPSSRGSIPTSVFPSFKKLLNPNPKARTSPKHFLAIGMAESPGEGSGFFANNKLVKICLGLDNFSLGSEAEKAVLLRSVGYLHRSPLFLTYQLR